MVVNAKEARQIVNDINRREDTITDVLNKITESAKRGETILRHYKIPVRSAGKIIADLEARGFEIKYRKLSPEAFSALCLVDGVMTIDYICWDAEITIKKQ